MQVDLLERQASMVLSNWHDATFLEMVPAQKKADRLLAVWAGCYDPAARVGFDESSVVRRLAGSIRVRRRRR